MKFKMLTAFRRSKLINYADQKLSVCAWKNCGNVALHCVYDWYCCNILNVVVSLLRNAPKERYEYEDDYKETDQLLDDEDRTEESVGNSSPQKKQKKTKKPSLSKLLWSLFGINFAVAVLCKLLNDMLLFVQPQLLK